MFTNELFCYNKNGDRMRKYLKEYVLLIDSYINEKKKANWHELKEEHLIKIQFFQHERFIHLCVTLTYALFALLSLVLIAVTPLFVIVALFFFGFLIPYIYHYFFLENHVQYLYKQYDEIKKKIKDN